MITDLFFTYIYIYVKFGPSFRSLSLLLCSSGYGSGHNLYDMLVNIGAFIVLKSDLDNWQKNYFNRLLNLKDLFFQCLPLW